MNAFPKYERYKDSGVEWLGEIPEHWEVEKGLRYLFETEDRSVKGDEELLSVSHLTGVTPRSEKNITMFMAESYEGSKLCDVGDIAINTMWAWMSALGVSKYRGLVSPSYGTYRQRKPERFNPPFLDHLIRTDVYRSHYTVNSTGITTSRLRLYPHSFLRLKFICPPREEQDRIVAFLDRKTAEIDALIAKKQRQIELLDEQKAILINRAVTRGLNPNVKLKPSGIEWIGDIPEHWVTAPMYSRCDVRLGKMLDAAKIKGKHLQPYLRNTDVQWFEINSLDLPSMDFRPEEYERYSVKRGDLVVCEGGEPGRAALWDSDEPCFFQKALHRVRPMKGDNPRFLLYLFRNAVTMAAFSGVDKATIAHLTGEQLRRFRFAFPPVTEQAGIADYLADAQTRFSEAAQKIESHIQSLHTLRSTLIAHAVTGKLKI